MAGCASAKDRWDEYSGRHCRWERSNSLPDRPLSPSQKQQVPAAEPATDGETPDLSGLPAMTGRYLRTKNGGNMVVLDREGPVSFQSTEEEPRFVQLHSGDKVEVKLEFIQETYPGQSEALDIRLLEKGAWRTWTPIRWPR